MSKFKLVLASIVTAGVFSLFVATANAQRPNPPASLVAQARAQGPCRDPWITIAIWDMFASTRQPQGVGDFGECNYKLYNGGSWSSYDELYRGVKTALDNMYGNVRITMSSLGGGQYKITTDAGGGYVWTQTVKAIGQAGGSLIGQGGSTLISQDGAGIVIDHGSNFRVQSTSDEKRINLGKSTLVIRSVQTSTGSEVGSETIQLCVNSPGSTLRSTRGITLHVTGQDGGTATFQGTMPSQSIRNTLISDAKRCGAKVVMVNGARAY